jgi:hypothetical protein
MLFDMRGADPICRHLRQRDRGQNLGSPIMLNRGTDASARLIHRDYEQLSAGALENCRLGVDRYFTAIGAHGAVIEPSR